MKYVALIIPALFFALFLYALLKKVRLYDCFTEGVKEAVPLLLSIFPYLAAMLMLSELFERSGLSAAITQALAPAFSALGIPPEISKLVLLKPFSGSGSLSLLTEVLEEYGADSYIARCACTIYSSSETVFYVFALYFAGTNKKGRAAPLAIVILSTILSTILSCMLCRVL